MATVADGDVREALTAIAKTTFVGITTDSEEARRVALESAHDIANAALERLTEQSDETMVERVRKWALEKSSQHHRLAVEDEHLRTEHIASSSAYRNLAEEVAALRREPD